MNSLFYGILQNRSNLQFPVQLSLKFAVLLIVMGSLFLTSCNNQDDEKPSRHAPFCKCSTTVNGEELKLESPGLWAESAFDQVLTESGIPLRVHKLCSTKSIPGDIVAFTTIINDLPYVVYDEEKLAIMSVYHKWATQYVLAHELGHIVNYHIFDNSITNPAQELEAEFFAGFILYRLGASLEETLQPISEDRKATATHPSGVESRNFAQNGWLKANHISPEQPNIPLPLSHRSAPPKRGFAKVRGRTIPTITIAGREIIAQDLDFEIGGARRYNDGYFGSRLYTHDEARVICHQLNDGWELLNDSDMKSLLGPSLSNQDNELNKQGFDAIGGYGRIIKDGQSGFNGGLGGSAFVNYGGYFFFGKGETGNYWISDFDGEYGQPLYYSLNSKTGSLVKYRDSKGLANYCRCARNVQN